MRYPRVLIYRQLTLVLVPVYFIKHSVSCYIYTPLGVCIRATGLSLTTINSSPNIPHKLPCLRAHWLLLAKNKLETGRDTGWQGKDGWVGLAEHQEGREKGGAHCLDMDKSVRTAT